MSRNNQPQSDDSSVQVELWRTEIQTRFSDMDAQCHINNLAYLEYIQECRVQWFRSLELGDRYESVVVNSNIEYLQEMFYPEPVTVIMTGSNPGRSSVKTWYEIWSPDDKSSLAARGYAKIVFIDPEERKSTPLPEIVREKLK